MLVTRPDYDDATSYTFYYAGLIIQEAEKKGIDVIDLARPRLTQRNFTAIVESQNPAFIFFNAHGDEKTIYGDERVGEAEVLVQEGKNHHLLDSRLTYARTCWAAASLGKACRNGCFIGYAVPFTFWTDTRVNTVPASDSTARLFFEPSNLIVRSLLKGNTPEEAVKKARNLSRKIISGLLKESGEGTTVLISGLWNNMEGTVIAGDRDMTIS